MITIIMIKFYCMKRPFVEPKDPSV